KEAAQGAVRADRLPWLIDERKTGNSNGKPVGAVFVVQQLFAGELGEAIEAVRLAGMGLVDGEVFGEEGRIDLVAAGEDEAGNAGLRRGMGQFVGSADVGVQQ